MEQEKLDNRNFYRNGFSKKDRIEDIERDIGDIKSDQETKHVLYEMLEIIKQIFL